MWNFIKIFVFEMQCQCICYREWEDHNGNKFYFKLYCVILDELSVFTTFMSNKNNERKKGNLQIILGNRYTALAVYTQ